MVQAILSKESVNLGTTIGVIIHPRKADARGHLRVNSREWVAEEMFVMEIRCEMGAPEAEGGTGWFFGGTIEDCNGEPWYLERVPIEQCYPTKQEALMALTD